MGSKLTNTEIFAEMARRKVRFHPSEDWENIRLWGLFAWGGVSHMLKDGRLITNMKKENEIIWVWPSADCWHNDIEPLIKKLSLYGLSRMAGWDVQEEDM
jgi:hypothetical protein